MIASRYLPWFCVAIITVALVGCGSAEPTRPAPAPLRPSPPAPQPPATRPSGDAPSRLRAAEAALDQGNLVLAEREFRDALALDPKSAKAQFGLGNVYVRMNRLADAEVAYKAALALDAGLASAHSNLGVVYYQMGQLARAAAEFQTALSIEPDDPQTLYLMAVVRLQENNLTAAEELLVKARDRKPDLPEVYFGLGTLYKLKGQKAEAIAAFEQFLALGPAQDPAAADYARRELQALKGN